MGGLEGGYLQGFGVTHMGTPHVAAAARDSLMLDPF